MLAILTLHGSQMALHVINFAHSGAAARPSMLFEMPWSQSDLSLISAIKGVSARLIMEALLLITLLMIAVDGPVEPSEINQDVKAGVMNEDSIQKLSVWTGGPQSNMWTGGKLQVEKNSLRSDDL
tara:strand:- start:388 stop:762 length:375 start_codon:yes stop_codon:yes gene_type:complete